MKMKLETITPEMAAQYLTANLKNRTLQHTTWAKYSKDMKRGEFKQTGDTIKFSKKGTLLDGQHRLKAIVDCEIAQSMLVVRGLDEQSFTYMDIGKKRSASDILSIEGYKNTSFLASALRTLYLLRIYDNIPVTVIKSSGTIQSYELLEIIKKEPKLESLIGDVGRFSFLRGVFGGGAVGMFYNKYLEDPELVLSFLEKVDKGANLPEKHPILYLRNYMLKDALSPYKMVIGMRYYLIARIWEDFRTRKPTRTNLALPNYTLESLIPLIR